jgi:hypothetical protein
MTQLDTQVRDTQVREVVPVRRDVSAKWALGTGVAWVVGYQAMLELEPAATSPDALPGFMLTAMAIAVNVGLVVMVAGLVRGARWAFAASGALAMLVVGQVVACPITGHHTLGAWWAVQAGIAAGLVVLSLAGWQASARSAHG